MAQAGTICPQCSMELAKGARFCGECGAAIPEASADKPLRGSHTIMGLDAAAVKAAAALIEARSKAAAEKAAAAQPPAPSDADEDAEELDADASNEEDAAADEPEKPSVEQKKPAAPGSSRRALGHTILGLSASDLPLPPNGPAATEKDKESTSTSAGGFLAPSPPASSSGAIAAPTGTGSSSGAIASPVAEGGKPPPKRTLLGIQSSSGAIVSPLGLEKEARFDKTQLEGEGIADLSTDPPTGPNPVVPDFASTRIEGGPLLGGGGRHATALGLGLPAAAPQQGPAPKSVQGRTMLGVPLSSLTPLPPAPEAAESVVSGQTRAAGSVWDDARSSRGSAEPALSLETPAAGGSNSAARSRIALVLAGLALLSLVAMVYVRFSGRTKSADVSARIITNQQGESLLFEIPRALAGSKLRFGGQEQAIVAGRATFPLASDSLRVGDNIVLADVIAPSGDTASARIVLAVFYRIWVDTSALRADRPSIDVVVTAIPGTKVTLEGQDVQLDGQGRATKTYPLDVVHSGKGGVIDHVVHYRMQPPRGETVVDELHTRIPVAMMQIDRPGPDIVTERESVEIAGAVGRETHVSIDGTQVPVKEGRFLHRLALPKPGEYKPRVIATAAGKAPLGVTLSIKRVRDISQAAREFSFDKSLTYAKIAPNATIYKGQNIAIEGRVYAVDSRAGSSVLQMLARPCPSTQRCSLWVVDPQAAEVSVDKWVRILGVVDGEQQFRSEKNEIVTVPKIVARFVLPAKP